jgi:hypothetical protein
MEFIYSRKTGYFCLRAIKGYFMKLLSPAHINHKGIRRWHLESDFINTLSMKIEGIVS